MKRIIYYVVVQFCLLSVCSGASNKVKVIEVKDYLSYGGHPAPFAEMEWGIPPYSFYYYPPRQDVFKQLVPPFVSDWTEWWEANRDPYLSVTHQKKGDTSAQDLQKEYRKKTIEALLKALELDVWELRASAAVALGRMDAKEAFEPLCKVAQNDKIMKVRQAAILAIGLLDSSEGEEFMLQLDFTGKPSDRQAALVAIGMMTELTSDTIAGFQKKLKNGLGKPRKFTRVKGKNGNTKVVGKLGLTAWGVSAWTLTKRWDPVDYPDPKSFSDVVDWGRYIKEGSSLATSAITCWALSRHSDPINTKLYQVVLGTTNVPWIADEVLLAIGRQGKKESASHFAEILLLTPKAKRLPVFNMLENQNACLWKVWDMGRAVRKRKDEEPSLINQSRLTYRRLMVKVYGYFHYLQMHEDCSEAKRPDYGWMRMFKDVDRMIWHVYLGVEPVYIANLRASAAIALGEIDEPISKKALQRVLTIKDDDYSHFYKSMAVMSLGKLGDVPTLLKILQPPLSRNIVSSSKLRSPLRGFAALAMGLYARPYQTEQGLADRKDCDKVCQLLAKVLANTKEDESLRAACALGLGVSSRTENLKYLQAASGKVGTNDTLLAGYVILARGMLGDSTILEPAKSYLQAAKEKEQKNKGRKVKRHMQKQWEAMVRRDMLGSRAAILGLGLTISREAIPVLEEAMTRNDYLADEAMLAMSLIGAYNTSEKLIELMKDSDDAKTRAKAARYLGELFAQPRPGRLSRLTNGSNYRMIVPRMIPYRTLANEFLYEFLLPRFTFENAWK